MVRRCITLHDHRGHPIGSASIGTRATTDQVDAIRQAAADVGELLRAARTSQTTTETEVNR